MASAIPEAEPENFQVLQGPKRADIARDRILKTTKAAYKVRGASNPRNVPLHDRVNQFPDENLIVKGSSIFFAVFAKRLCRLKRAF